MKEKFPLVQKEVAQAVFQKKRVKFPVKLLQINKRLKSVCIAGSTINSLGTNLIK